MNNLRLDLLSLSEKRELVRLLEEKQRRNSRNQFYAYFPDSGDYARSGYKKHMEFFDAGKEHRERLFLAANRVGKTVVGGYEMTCHLTGIYPKWWTGRRFSHAIQAWASGDTSQTTRDIQQEILLGPPGSHGTGMIPGDLITVTRPRTGVPDAVETISVKHTSGQVSRLGLKSYDQKRRSFQGTAQHVIWLDEEPPLDVYSECLLRTMTTDGLMILTFTPLLGLSDVVLQFLPGGKLPQ